MALNSNQPHKAPSIGPENRETEAEGRDSTCQQNNGHLPPSRGNTPECLMVKLITVCLLLGWSLREHFITGGNHETARGIPILEFGMKRVEALPCSAALKHRTSQYSSKETRRNKKCLFCWGHVTPEYATGWHW